MKRWFLKRFKKIITINVVFTVYEHYDTALGKTWFWLVSRGMLFSDNNRRHEQCRITPKIWVFEASNYFTPLTILALVSFKSCTSVIDCIYCKLKHELIVGLQYYCWGYQFPERLLHTVIRIVVKSCVIITAHYASIVHLVCPFARNCFSLRRK